MRIEKIKKINIKATLSKINGGQNNMKRYLKPKKNSDTPGKRLRDRFVLYTIMACFIGLVFLGYNHELGKVFSVAQAEVSVPKHEQLSPREEICKAIDGENCDVLYNLMMRESGGNKYAINKNKNGTFDYSWFQINQINIKGMGKHGVVDMECVYNLTCIAQWTNRQIKAGNGYIWAAWNYL